MNNEIAMAEAIQNIDFKELDTMMNGCNQAVLILGINQYGWKLSKMVLAYNSRDVSFEEVVAGAGHMIKYSNFALTRAFVYTIDDDKQVKHLDYIKLWPLLIKDVPGYTPGEFVHDLRRKKRTV